MYMSSLLVLTCIGWEIKGCGLVVKWVMGGFALCVEIFNDEVYDSPACELIRSTQEADKDVDLNRLARGLLKEE
jgi:hypothetical protein